MKKLIASVFAYVCFSALPGASPAFAQSFCQTQPTYTHPGSHSGTASYTMTICASDASTNMNGTYRFDNYADAPGEAINGSYGISYVVAMSATGYTYTYTLNGGPITFDRNRQEVYYDQLSVTVRWDGNQEDYLGYSGGMRINGVHYPASAVYEYIAIGDDVPTFDPGYLDDIANPPADTTPDAFGFAAVADAAPGAAVESGTITVAGIDASAAISISGGQYSINGGTWTASSGTVSLGSRVKLRLTAPSGYGATGSAMLTIGGVSARFTVTTRGFTPVTDASQVFANPQTATVVDGVVRITAAPSAPLQLAAGAVPNAVVALDTADPVPVLSGTAILNYTRGGSDTALQIRTIDGNPALTPIAGHVGIAAPARGTIPLTGDDSGSATLSSGDAGTQVTAGRDANRNLVVAITSGPVTYTSSGGVPRATRSLPSSFTVHPGEAVLADDGGAPGQVRLGSFAQDGTQAGDFIANLPRAAATLQVPRVAGSSARFGSDWTSLVGQAIAGQLGLGTATSLTQDAASGLMTLVTSAGTYRFLPVGTLALADAAFNPARAVSVADIAANLTAILDQSLSFAVAPATPYADLERALKSLSSAASLEILGDGVLKASLAGTDFIVQPAAQATDGSAAGCPNFVTENNLLALCDADGQRQVLNAAFADTDAVVATCAALLPGLTISNTGANGQYSTTFPLAGTTVTATLVPDITLTASPASQAGNLWWLDSATGKIFIRYPDGSAQGFGVQ